jgi:hypothetical protein
MAPLASDFESFYTRRLYGRLADCWNRPISATPGPMVSVLERKSLDPLFNTKFECVSSIAAVNLMFTFLTCASFQENWAHSEMLESCIIQLSRLCGRRSIDCGLSRGQRQAIWNQLLQRSGRRWYG